MELLAVAPGAVVEAMRDLPDVPAGEPPTNLTIAEIAGNHVTLDLGGEDLRFMCTWLRTA